MRMRMLRRRWCGVVARRCRSGMNDVLTEWTLASGGTSTRRSHQRCGHYIGFINGHPVSEFTGVWTTKCRKTKRYALFFLATVQTTTARLRGSLRCVISRKIDIVVLSSGFLASDAMERWIFAGQGFFFLKCIQHNRLNTIYFWQLKKYEVLTVLGEVIVAGKRLQVNCLVLT